MPVHFHSDLEDTTISSCPGRPFPLGATYDGHGINFALYSEYATKVYLCLFRPSHDESRQLVEYARINIKGKYQVQSNSFLFISMIYLNNSFLSRTNASDLACLFT